MTWKLDPALLKKTVETYKHFLDGVEHEGVVAHLPEGSSAAIERWHMFDEFLDTITEDDVPSAPIDEILKVAGDYGAAVLMTLLLGEEHSVQIIGGDDFPDDPDDHPRVSPAFPSELFVDDEDTKSFDWFSRPLIDVLREWIYDDTLSDEATAPKAHLAVLKDIVAKLEAEVEKREGKRK